MNLRNKIIVLCAIIYTPFSQAQNVLVSLDSASIPDVTLGEVVIAASRDNSKIKDIPGSVSSIRTSEIEGNQIQSLEDLSTFAPNFMMLDYGTKIMSPIYIRGIGSKKTTVNPSVGLYVDGIPYFDNSALSFDFYDICQVEVLRGPQGTLYGRNAIGGLVNITTLSPMNYQGTRIRATAAEYDNYNATISHYNRIGDRFAFSIAGNYNYQGGYFKNIETGKQSDKSVSYSLRKRLIYQLNNNYSIENISGLEISKQYGYPYAPYIDSIAELSEVNYNEESGYERIMFNDGLHLKYNNQKMAGQLTLAYHFIDDEQKVDQDFKPSKLFLATQEQNQHMLTSELVLRSNNKGKYQWIAGAFNNIQSQDKYVLINYFPPYNRTKDFYEKNYTQMNSSTGVFHQSKVRIGENLSASAGIRINNESSQLDYDHTETLGDIQTEIDDTSFSTLHDFAILPKVAIQYAIGHSTIYASYTTGYKPGGFNATFEEQEQIKFKKEQSNNYEIGFKTDLLNGIIYSDISFFFSNITGQQIARSLTTRTGTYLENSGESENKGVEFSFSTAPINGFETSVNYGYTYAKITEYKKSETMDYSGNINPYVPNHTLNIMLAQTFETKQLRHLDNIRIQANFQQIGDTYWDLENTQLEEAYNLSNMTLSLNYKQFKLDFWGKNLFDTQYHAYMFKTSTWYGQRGLPRRFGSTLTLEF